MKLKIFELSSLDIHNQDSIILAIDQLLRYIYALKDEIKNEDLIKLNSELVWSVKTLLYIENITNKDDVEEYIANNLSKVLDILFYDKEITFNENDFMQWTIEHSEKDL